MKVSKKLRWIVAGAVVIIIVGSIMVYRATASAQDAAETAEQKKGEREVEEQNSFSEEGTTQISTDSQMPEFLVNAVTMTVEEVYVSAGDTVSEGDSLFKLTDESMKNATAYYEKAVDDATKTLQTAKSDLEIGQLEAQNVLQEAQLNAESAADVYQAAIDRIDVEVEEKKEAYDEAVASIEEYQTNLDDGVYYVQAQIDEKQEAVNQAAAAVEQAQQTLTAAQSAEDGADQTVTANFQVLQQQITDNADYETLLTLVQQTMTDYEAQKAAADSLLLAKQTAEEAESTLKQVQQTFDAAVETYNRNTENANEKITEFAEELEDLNNAYEQAQRDAVTLKAEAQNEYDTAVLEGKYANSSYETAVAVLETAVETAQKTLDNLKEEQTALLAAEDGIIKASQAGTLASVTYEAQNVLMADTAFVSYYEMDTVMISVEVAQEQIAQISVGDEVEVNISGNRNGTRTGTISSIASSATTGGSMSKVTYAVIISIDNSDGQLGTGASANVIFTYQTSAAMADSISKESGGAA